LFPDAYRGALPEHGYGFGGRTSNRSALQTSRRKVTSRMHDAAKLLMLLPSLTGASVRAYWGRLRRRTQN